MPHSLAYHEAVNRAYDSLTIDQALDREIIEAVRTSIEHAGHPAWGPALEVGDEIEDLEIPIPADRDNRVRRTVYVEQRHVDAAKTR